MTTPLFQDRAWQLNSMATWWLILFGNVLMAMGIVQESYCPHKPLLYMHISKCESWW